MGEQRLSFSAQGSVEEGEQVGAFGRECRRPVESPDLKPGRLPRGGVQPRQLRDEEDEIAEREVARASYVDGVAGSA